MATGRLFLASCPRHLQRFKNEAQAATHAETGQFTRAVEIARQAVALAERAGATGLDDGIRTRLDLYLAEKPFREPPP